MNLINHNDQIEKSFRRLMTPEANLNFVFLSVNKLHGEETDRRGHTLPLTLDLTTGSSAGGLPDSQIDAVTDEFEKFVVFLGIVKMHGRHTSQAILAEYDQLQERKISSNKVSTILAK